MNRKLQQLYIFLCSSVLGLLITGAFFCKPVQSENITTTVSSCYILKEYSGKLAVFSDGNDIPEEVLNVDISVFPACDKENLKNGIHAYSRDELYRLIEDFSG